MATKDPSRVRKPRPWRWTRAHLARLPDDGQRYEVLDGALLVTPQARPAHQGIAAWLTVELGLYCRRHAIGVVVGPGAVVWGDNELQPDVQVIPGVRSIPGGADWTDLPMPLLVVEVLSPGSARHDRVRKREAYLRLNIPEYWIVDPETRTVEVRRPAAHAPELATDAIAWAPLAGVDPLRIDLKALFAE